MNISKELMQLIFEYDGDDIENILVEQEQMNELGSLGYSLKKQILELPKFKFYMMTNAFIESDPSGFNIDLPSKLKGYNDISGSSFMILLFMTVYKEDDDENKDLQFTIYFNNRADAIEIECKELDYMSGKTIFKIQL